VGNEGRKDGNAAQFICVPNTSPGLFQMVKRAVLGA
jgi:hypothetical protein